MALDIVVDWSRIFLRDRTALRALDVVARGRAGEPIGGLQRGRARLRTQVSSGVNSGSCGMLKQPKGFRVGANPSLELCLASKICGR